MRLTITWFLCQAVWVAFSTNFGIPPDEEYHFGLIKLFSENGWLPFIHSQNGYYFLGEVAHTPFFIYHYILSLPFHIFAGSPHNVEILRLINIALATSSFFLINRLAIRLKISPLVKNLSLFMLANTLMFVFLAASINYDNLLIPIALLTFNLVYSIYDRLRLRNLLLSILVIIVGTLTVVNYLPIAAVSLIFIITIAIKRRREFPGNLSHEWLHDRVMVSLLGVGGLRFWIFCP